MGVEAASLTHDTADRRGAGVRLLDALPDMQAAVRPDEREFARRVVLAPLASLEPGPVLAWPGDAACHAFAWVVLDGIVLRRTSLRDRAAAEILGAGDIIDTRPDEHATAVRVRTQYVVHRAASIAVLDDRFRLAARRWPGLHDVVSTQMGRQVRRASAHLAAMQLPRVGDRLAAVFCDLADRWGRVTAEGIVIDIPLTHELLGDVVGSRRPTVTLALIELAASGAVTRRHDRTWLVSPALLNAP